MKIDGVFSGGGIKGQRLLVPMKRLKREDFNLSVLLVQVLEQSLLHSSQQVLQARKFGSF